MKDLIYLLFELPTTLVKLLSFHNALKKRKYRPLYSPRGGRKPGPKGPSKEVIDAIVEMKKRNPRYGFPLETVEPKVVDISQYRWEKHCRGSDRSNYQWQPQLRIRQGYVIH